MTDFDVKGKTLRLVFGYQVGTRIVALLLLTVVFGFFIIISPFGLADAVGERSRDTIRRIMSPWWGAFSADWQVPPEEALTTVVLVFRHPPTAAQPQRTSIWPLPTYRWRDLFVRTLGACPAVLVIDIIFDTPRGAEFLAMLEDMQQAANRCPRPPALEFADARTAIPGDRVHLLLQTFVQGQQKAGMPLVKTGFGVVQSPTTEEGADSPYRGISNLEYYRPYLLADDGGGGVWRESLALAAYGAWCLHRGGIPCPPPADGPDMGDAERSELRRRFDAPMDIQWPRWSPRSNQLFWRHDEQPDFFIGPGGCIQPEGLTWAQRLGESIRLAFASLIDGKIDSSPSTVMRCGPSTAIAGDWLSQLPLPESGAVAPIIEPGVAGYWAVIWKLAGEALQRAVLRDQLRGKVVFIGAYQGIRIDMVETPAQGALPGVYRHALAFENFARFGPNYYSLPESNLLAGLGVTIGADKILELLLSLMLSVVIIRLRRAKVIAAAWKCACREAEAAQSAGHCFDLRSLIFTLAAHFVTIIVTVVPAVAISLLVLAGGMTWGGWSSANWIGVSVLAFIPALLIGQSQRTGESN